MAYLGILELCLKQRYLPSALAQTPLGILKPLSQQCPVPSNSGQLVVPFISRSGPVVLKHEGARRAEANVVPAETICCAEMGMAELGAKMLYLTTFEKSLAHRASVQRALCPAYSHLNLAILRVISIGLCVHLIRYY